MILVDQALCAGCAMCVTACPEGAIECPGLAVIDPNRCTECLECLDYCPTDALTKRKPLKERYKQEAIVFLKEKYA